MKYAVQLYSLAPYIEKHGLKEALKLVHEAGYKGVEFAGFYGHTASTIQQWLDEYGLKAISAHIAFDQIIEQLPIIIDLHLPYVVIPYISFEQWDTQLNQTIQQIQMIQNELKKHHIELGYHNHALEFENGRNFIAILHQNIPNLLLELDVCWLTVAKQNITDTFNQYSKQLKIIHIKDFSSYKAVAENTPIIGKGLVPMKEVFFNAVQHKVEWCIMETENVNQDYKDYLVESLKNMISLENEVF